MKIVTFYEDSSLSLSYDMNLWLTRRIYTYRNAPTENTPKESGDNINRTRNENEDYSFVVLNSFCNESLRYCSTLSVHFFKANTMS